MQTTKQPYELLIRWGQDGRITGSQVQHRYIIKDGEKIVGESVGNAEPLALDGFPLADVLTQAQADALAEVERVKAESASKEASLNARIAELEAMQAAS